MERLPTGNDSTSPSWESFSDYDYESYDALLANSATTRSQVAKAPSRSSSLYSTKSASTTSSIGTTISQIVDMYTDLISKIPYAEEISPDVQLLQPRAYRDTVLPLLIRRFSADQLEPKHISAPPAPQIPDPWMKIDELESPSSHSYKQAPGFQEFSRNLKARRAELVSPLSSNSSYHVQLLTKDTPQSSPLTPPMRPFSWTSDEMDVTVGIDQSSISPISEPEKLSLLSSAPTDRFTVQKIESRSSRPPPTDGRNDSGEQLHFIKALDVMKPSPSTQPTRAQEPTPLTPCRARSEQHRRRHSTASDSTDSFVIYTGVGETMKAMIKDKLKQRRAGKEKAQIIATASRKYPGMTVEHRQNSSSQERRKTSLRDDCDTVIRRLSVTGSSTDRNSTPLPRRRQKPASVPLTPYQKHGMEVWFSKNKKKRKEERRRAREANQSKKPQIETQLDSRDKHESMVVQSPLAKSNEATDLQSPQGKKHGLMAALEGARNSLIHSSAEKRREKLKESIVIVGPTQLTYANAMADERS